jgi:protein ImuA
MSKQAVLAQLRTAIATVEGRPARLEDLQPGQAWQFGSADLDARFGLAVAAMHTVAPDCPAHWASAAAIALRLLQRLPAPHATRPLLWVQTTRSLQERGRLSAAALTNTGLTVDRLICLDVRTPAEALWALEEALQTPALAAVVAAGIDIGFTASRRLALAAAACAVPLLHLPEQHPANTAATTSWTVTPRTSAPDPLVAQAVGRPRWQLDLVRAKLSGAKISGANMMAWPARVEVEWDDATLCFNLVAGLGAGTLAAVPAPPAGANTATSVFQIRHPPRDRAA